MKTHSPPNLSLRDLYYFVVLAEELHFSRAAARIGICESPLSRAIARLERSLDSRLFKRNSQRTRLTQAGEALLPEARSLLNQAERVRGVIAAVSAAESRSSAKSAAV
jgi:DNA-binding transcriptional LysR family regulator